MQRQPVASTSVRSIGYEAKGRCLEIEFVSGGVYRYFEVPAALYVALMNAQSKGAFFQETIRDRFRYERVE